MPFEANRLKSANDSFLSLILIYSIHYASKNFFVEFNFLARHLCFTGFNLFFSSFRVCISSRFFFKFIFLFFRSEESAVVLLPLHLKCLRICRKFMIKHKQTPNNTHAHISLSIILKKNIRTNTHTNSILFRFVSLVKKKHPLTAPQQQPPKTKMILESTRTRSLSKNPTLSHGLTDTVSHAH